MFWPARRIFPFRFGRQSCAALNAEVTRCNPRDLLHRAVIPWDAGGSPCLPGELQELCLCNLCSIDPKRAIKAHFANWFFVTVARIAAHHETARWYFCHFYAVKGLELGSPLAVGGH